MIKRESNKRIMLVFVLCALTTAIVTWTLGEKFISDSRIAFFVEAFLAAGIGMLFGRYLESRLNASVDFLIDKIGRVAKGDLTQVFKEDADDIMPYGLSWELNGMMRYFKENIGNLWRTSSVLVKQLNLFIGSSQEVLGEFRVEVDSLSSLRNSLEHIRKNTTDLIRKLSELRVNAVSDVEVMKQVNGYSSMATGEISKSKVLLKSVEENVSNLRDNVNHLDGVLRGLNDVVRGASLMRKAISELSTEANLVKLNTAIDSTQAHDNTKDNYLKLLDETRAVVEKIASISQESGNMLSSCDGKIGVLQNEMDTSARELRKGLDNLRKSTDLLNVTGEKASVSASGCSKVLEHVQAFSQILTQVDGAVSRFAEAAKSAEQLFDKVYSDSHITLLKFDDLGSKVSAIKDNLRQLEQFNHLFDIA